MRPTNTKKRYQRMVDLTTHLLNFQKAFGEKPHNQNMAASSARNVCVLYAQFSKQAKDPRFWRVNPKFHLLLHLAEKQTADHGDTSLFWAHADEDFVGFIGTVAVTRGGKRVALTTPHNVMAKYRGTV